MRNPIFAVAKVHSEQKKKKSPFQALRRCSCFWKKEKGKQQGPIRRDVKKKSAQTCELLSCCPIWSKLPVAPTPASIRASPTETFRPVRSPVHPLPTPRLTAGHAEEEGGSCCFWRPKTPRSWSAATPRRGDSGRGDASQGQRRIYAVARGRLQSAQTGGLRRGDHCGEGRVECGGGHAPACE